MSTAEFPIATDDSPTMGPFRCSVCDRMIEVGQPYEVRPMGFRDRGEGNEAAELNAFTCVYCPTPEDFCEGALDYFKSVDP